MGDDDKDLIINELLDIIERKEEDMSTVSMGISNTGLVINDSAPITRSNSLESVTGTILDDYLLSEIRYTDDDIKTMNLTEDEFKKFIKRGLFEKVFKGVKPKAKFTKLYDRETRSTIFRSKVYVFTEDELKKLVEKVYNS